MIRNRALRVFARTCLVALFPFTAAEKVLDWNQAIKQAKNGPLSTVAPILLVGAVAIEAVAPIAVVTGRRDREGAALLAGFCAATALMYHRFWTYDDLFAAKSQGRNELWEFLKNFGLVGGLLYVACGQRPAPSRAKTRR